MDGYGNTGDVVTELSVESPNLELIESPDGGNNAVDGSDIKEEDRSKGISFESDKKSEGMFGDEWVPMTLKKAMASVLGKMKGGKSSKDNQNRSAKALERDKKKIMLMDALIDLAREMAKKKAKERSMAKVMSKEKEKQKKFMKERKKERKKKKRMKSRKIRKFKGFEQK